MKQIAYPENKSVRLILVLILFVVYLPLFAAYHNKAEIAASALATIPVIGAAWYFGSGGGILTAIVVVLCNIAILRGEGISLSVSFTSPNTLVGTLALVFIGLLVGKLGSIIQEGKSAIAKLERYEHEREAHMEFLEQLHSITSRALEANSLQSTLQILVEQIGGLFEASDSYFSLWDDTRGVPIPVAASGSMAEIYPYFQFAPTDHTITAALMEVQAPIAIPDIENSPYLSRNIAALFPNRSMLGLPLIAQDRKLGGLLLGYRKSREFEKDDLLHAAATAEQVALVLSKSLLLEEERKQVKQLTALHDSALIAIDADDEDDLINRVTELIGQNLFPDNFGILLLHEPSGILRIHPSYRFFSGEEHRSMEISIDQGVTGLVARTGCAQRISNVRENREYLDVDARTVSELCVPIKFKERILGVINAESTKKGAFSADDERLLVTLASQMATALEQIRIAQAERRWLDQLAHSNDLIYALAQITTHIEKAFSIDDIIRNLGKELSRIDLSCIMAVYDKDRALFSVDYTSLAPGLLETVEECLGYPLVRHSFSRDRLKLDTAAHAIPPALIEEEIQMLLARNRPQGSQELMQQIGLGSGSEPLRLPLVFEENLLGILWIWGRGVARADLPIMSIFAKQIGVSLERARLFQEVQSLALTDPLTGLQNRRSLFELGRLEFARAQRMKRAFCCMMLDLDHFKEINDQYGHLVGDQVLQEFASRCSRSVREIDLVGRYGGEELMIFLPETDGPTAIHVAERLRSAIASSPISVFDREIRVTVSIGVATQDENTTDLETLIARADQAMYIAKHKGRNRVAISK